MLLLCLRSVFMPSSGLDSALQWSLSENVLSHSHSFCQIWVKNSKAKHFLRKMSLSQKPRERASCVSGRYTLCRSPGSTGKKEQGVEYFCRKHRKVSDKYKTEKKTTDSHSVFLLIPTTQTIHGQGFSKSKSALEGMWALCHDEDKWQPHSLWSSLHGKYLNFQ